MAVRTREEYIEDLKKRKPKVFIEGERVENVAEHPIFKVGINCAAITFDQANDAECRDLARVWSPIINGEVSRWTHLMQTEQDALAKAKLSCALGKFLCPCHYRCLTGDLLHAAWAASYELDHNYGTSYHERVVEIVKQAQESDWIIGGGLVPPKGDRSKSATAQADRDMYLHIVARNGNGIVVRGAKAHSTAAPYTDMLCVVELELHPDYCVGFFTPTDTPGVAFICRAPHAPSKPKDIENPLSSRFGGHVEAMIVFDDVFVPWERVFICGELDSIATFGQILVASHLWHKCLCRWVNIDLSIGATALVADYNGVGTAPHIIEALCEMGMDAEIVKSCAIAAAIEGVKHESGVYYPKLLPAATGKLYGAKKLGEHRYYMQDAAGGLVATMASEKDFKSPTVSKYLEKYYQGREGVSTETRVRAIRLIEDLTASEFAGWYHAICISGGGAAKTIKDLMFMALDLEGSKQRAKLAARITD